MRLYGLIGKSLSHSFSKSYFSKKFAAEGITDCVYESFELANIADFSQLIQSHPELCGLNVTIPYKEMVMPYLDEISPEVEKIGACNCIKIDNGKLIGYNTDAAGFRASIKPQLKTNHQYALVFGSGGASKAICFALQELGIEYRVVSRKKVAGQLGYEDIDDVVLEKYHLLINTTPLGMYPNVDDDPPIPYEELSPQHFLYDVIYNPEKTRFLQRGEAQGAQICNGQGMLVLQAEESWGIWNGLKS
ncbi:MAG: shikimate dehydrogenase [Flaviaesturariibacter sp.]|nr:shikimate dehydrogenase [Flaviaesturariibacter sp.]